jgi:hypothetical protein
MVGNDGGAAATGASESCTTCKETTPLTIRLNRLLFVSEWYVT